MPESVPLPPSTIHSLIAAAFEAQKQSYSPYSKFPVGAALLDIDGMIIGGCNVENASYGGAICAERTAMTKAISSGIKRFTALAVTSALPKPTISPCGICRQFLNEFLGSDTPIFMVGAEYPLDSAQAPAWLDDLEGAEAKEFVHVMTMGEILPKGFGPKELAGK